MWIFFLFLAAAELYDFDDDKVDTFLSLSSLSFIEKYLGYFWGIFLWPCLMCFGFMKDENKFDFKKIVSDNWIEPPKRERKRK